MKPVLLDSYCYCPTIYADDVKGGKHLLCGGIFDPAVRSTIAFKPIIQDKKEVVTDEKEETKRTGIEGYTQEDKDGRA